MKNLNLYLESLCKPEPSSGRDSYVGVDGL